MISTQYISNLTIIYMVKMESVSKITILGITITVKIFFEIPPCGNMVILITESVTLGTFMKLGKVVSRMEEFQKYFLLDHFSSSFLGQKLYF